MPLTWKSLADGQLPDTIGALYTVPTDITASICCIVITNTDSSSRTFNIYITRVGSSARRISGKDTALAAGAKTEICPDPMSIRLSEGDIISGDASVAAKLDYFISGVESS